MSATALNGSELGTLWYHAHGAAVHLPLGLVMGSGLLDAAAVAWRARPAARDLRAAAHWALVLGALGAVPAAVSGLVLTEGRMWGRDALRMHHLFVWPAFGLVCGLAVWRIASGRPPGAPMPVAYLGVVFAAMGLLAGAGFWGGVLAGRP